MNHRKLDSQKTRVVATTKRKISTKRLHRTVGFPEQYGIGLILSRHFRTRIKSQVVIDTPFLKKWHREVKVVKKGSFCSFYATRLGINDTLFYCQTCCCSYCCFYHCLKSIQIRRFSGPYFPIFGLNTEIYECGKIRTRKISVFGKFSRSANDLVFP